MMRKGTPGLDAHRKSMRGNGTRWKNPILHTKSCTCWWTL
jgi:hypothetical protein